MIQKISEQDDFVVPAKVLNEALGTVTAYLCRAYQFQYCPEKLVCQAGLYRSPCKELRTPAV
jgi:hypothetical protein